MGRWRTIHTPVAALLLLALMSLVTLAGDSAPGVLIVGPNGEYATIQAAIDAAPDGATILVRSGTYVENLLIEKPVTLIGSGDVIVEPLEAQDPTLTIESADGARLSGFEVRGGSAAVTVQDSNCMIVDCSIIAGFVDALRESVAIDISAWRGPPSSPTTCTIMGCTIEVTEFGIVAFPSAPCEVLIDGCRISGVEAAPGSTWDKDFARGGYRGAGLSAMGPCDIMVIESVFESLAQGASFGGTGTQAIARCTYRSCGIGLWGFDSGQAVIADSQIIDNTLDGLYIGHSYSPEDAPGELMLLRNHIERNGGWGIHQGNSLGEEEHQALVTFFGADNVVRDNGSGAFNPDSLTFPEGFFADESAEESE